ncbi:rRNA-processing protein UTP23 [Cyberlindnera fabianii]|uniref:U three protein 23 n=1 Tax=Cyberlindnera fabianii TaxID=36022 RepID=A0A1V2L9S3_CYBFA|nr:rRNA-processing protein UTP23 [Cyberlindnera fabianii]
MRQKRAKSYRKQMLVYQHTFRFREPYQVIIDDALVLECDRSSFDLAKGLSRTLQAEIKPMITQCCMQALYETKNQSAIQLAQTFERRKCGHFGPNTKPPHECIKSIVDINGTNKHRYVVASENDRLRFSLRKVPGVPLVHMKRSVMIMEPLSITSARASTALEKSKLVGGLNNIKVGTAKDGELAKAEEQANASQIKKKRGPKEPNPLSIKKKKSAQTGNKDESQETGEKKKRRRKHKKSTEDGEEHDEKKESVSTKDDNANNESHDENMSDASD